MGSKKGEGERGHEVVLALGAAGDIALVILGYDRCRCAAARVREAAAAAADLAVVDADAIGPRVQV